MLPNIFWSRTDYISGAYATKMVAISSPDTSVLDYVSKFRDRLHTAWTLARESLANAQRYEKSIW